ncbi:MAG: PAS domain S-box protein, partial [Nitrospirae bacterium]|nr:PAS domain S-box protein [Nitrospirota bacterium]
KKIEHELVKSNLESARLYEKMRLAEQELKNIFESISDLVYIIDCDYNILKVNKAVCDLIGLPMQEIVGKKCHEVFHNIGTIWEKCLHRKTIENKKSYICEVDSFYYKGNDTYGMSNSPIIDTQGNILGTVNIVRNTTELKKLTAQLASFEKMAMLGEVAAGMAHSIRNPLVSIGGFAKRLAQKLDPPYSEYAGIIQTEAGRLEDLLKKTIGFVQSAKASMSAVDLNTLIVTLIHMTTINNSADIIIEEEISKELIEIIGDAGRLKDAFSNIIKNAVQSIDKKGRIVIRLYSKDGFAVIEVEDSGIGLKKEALKHIFDPFYTTKPEGTGLGLAIAHKIIMQHSGSIDVSSIHGSGTIFTIKIPLKEVSEQ